MFGCLWEVFEEKCMSVWKLDKKIKNNCLVQLRWGNMFWKYVMKLKEKVKVLKNY